MNQYAMVKLNQEYKDWLLENSPKSDLLSEQTFIFFGEIPNMKEHCVVAGCNSGLIYSGHHIDNFVVLAEDEV